MEYLYERENTLKIIKKYGFDFKKKFGQNFLINGEVINSIVDGAEITKDDVVIEIGPGIGTLTQVLADRAYKVIAIEIDKTLIPILKNDTLKDYKNIEIINEDIMKLDLRELINNNRQGKKIKVVANLPYYITTPIIMMLLEEKYSIDSITVMIQKEVAERFNAESGTKEYGAITVAIKYFTSTNIINIVSKNMFVPSPKVDSAVINLKVLDKPSIYVKNEDIYFKIVKSAFAQRRKTLVNTLYNTTDYFNSKDEIRNILIKNGMDVNIRGEKLNLEEFEKIAKEVI